MNIQELAKRAIERINSMSLDELEKKFIEHGYPSEQNSNCVSHRFTLHSHAQYFLPNGISYAGNNNLMTAANDSLCSTSFSCSNNYVYKDAA